MTIDTKLSRDVDTLYVVKAGDSLSRIAQTWYGDATKATLIATKNNIDLQSIPYIGQRLILPALTPSSESAAVSPPASPGGSTPVAYNGEIIETVTTTARVWWKDWRYWVAIGGAAALLWTLSNRRRKR